MGTVVSLRKYSEYGTLVDTDENAFATESGASPSESAIDHDALGNVHQDVNTTASPEFVGLTTTGGRIVNTTRIISTDSPYSVLVTDHVIDCDTDGGAITVNLLPGVEGTQHRIINCGSSGNNVTVDGDAAEAVCGELTQVLYDDDVIDLVYNATEGWR